MNNITTVIADAYNGIWQTAISTTNDIEDAYNYAASSTVGVAVGTAAGVVSGVAHFALKGAGITAAGLSGAIVISAAKNALAGRNGDALKGAVFAGGLFAAAYLTTDLNYATTFALAGAAWRFAHIKLHTPKAAGN